MNSLRIIDSNIINLIQEDILGNPLGQISGIFSDYTIQVKNSVLKFDLTDSINKSTSGTTNRRRKESKRVWRSKFNNFVYWFPTNDIEVRKNNSTVNVSQYYVNFAEGKIVFGIRFGQQIRDTDVITVSARVSLVSIEKGYSTKINELNVPFVVVERLHKKSRPFEIGNLPQRELPYIATIFANDDGQLTDLEEILSEKIEFAHKTVLDYRIQQPLKEFGIKNPKFDIQKIETDYFIEFEDVFVSKIRLPDASKNQEHISQVFFTAITQFR